MTGPTSATPGGRAYLGLQRLARENRRAAGEYFRLYALEGFLLRLAHSKYATKFVLKGGVLLAAFDLRRPTTDIDLAGVAINADIETIAKITIEIASTPLPVELDDGLTFDIEAGVTAQMIRDEDEYSGVRVSLTARLVTARERFHVDVNIGDPIYPTPAEVDLPRLLDEEPIRLRGYPIEMVLAEKIVTAVQRGTANTRWRDFADIYLISREHELMFDALLAAVTAVARFRDVELVALRETLAGYPEIAQTKWSAWLRRVQLGGRLPEAFADVLDTVFELADPILADNHPADTRWSPIDGEWQR